MLLLVASCDEDEPTKPATFGTEQGCLNHDSCRGDEMCQAGQCLQWQEADLWVDFAIRFSEINPHRATIDLITEGYPLNFVAYTRVDLGDGMLGFGDHINHIYDEDGVYPITAEVWLKNGHSLTASKVASIGPATYSQVSFE